MCLWPGPSSTPWLHTDAFFPPCTRLLSTLKIWIPKDWIKDTLWIQKLRLTSQCVPGRHWYLWIQIDCRESFPSWQQCCHGDLGWSDILSNCSQPSIPSTPCFPPRLSCGTSFPKPRWPPAEPLEQHELTDWECLLHWYTSTTCFAWEDMENTLSRGERVMLDLFC